MIMQAIIFMLIINMHAEISSLRATNNGV